MPSLIELIARYLVFLYAIPLLGLCVLGDIATTITATIGAGIAWYSSVMLKLLIRRPRPYIREGIKAAMDDPPTDFSFPSGHTATSLGLSTAVAVSHPILGTLLMLLGASVGIARIKSRVHAPEDIIAGIILGIVSGLLATKSVNLMLQYLVG